jgi:WD40 repeat protein/serine/threonine protein kinase
MSVPLPATGPGVIAEDDLAEVVEHLTARLKAGEAVDLDACLAAHPDHAAELRRLIPALELLADLSRPPGPAVRCSASAIPEAAEALGQLGDFRLIREVGRGGMGVVYEAEQISLGRRVALKVLPFAAALDARQLQRFKNEAQAAAHLQHQHILPVYYVGVERGVHFYAMQFIEGQTLAQLTHELREQVGPDRPAARRDSRSTDADATGPYHAAGTAGSARAEAQVTGPNLSLRAETLATTPEAAPPIHAGDFFHTAVRLAVQAAEALEHAHQLGVVHRDIKPANLLVDARGELWVTDFGLAQVQGDAKLTLTGDLVGTLRYMSPEQARGRGAPIDHRTDIYSLGVTLYELLTLEPAFGGTDRQHLLRQIALEEPRPLRRLNKSIPAELEVIVLKAIEKNPADRYATAQELADDLQRWLKNEPIRARRVRPWERLVKWVRRHPAPAGLALVSGLAAMALAGVAVAWSYGTRLAAANAELESAKGATESAYTQIVSTNTRLAQALEETGAKQVEADTQRAEAQRQRALGERYLYASHMLLAENAWQQGRMEETLRLLELHAPTAEHPVDLRGFEWYYLLRLCRAARLPLRGHAAAVRAVWVSPDGRRVASAGADHTVRVWDLAAGREVVTVRLEADKITVLAFSPDGKRLAGAALDGAVRIYDAATGRELACCKGHSGPVNCVAFSPDGKHVASSSDGVWNAVRHDFSVRVWDARTGAEVITLADQVGPVYAVAFSPDGRWLATGTWENQGQPNVAVWDWRAGRQKLSARGPRSATRALAFSPDGRLLAAAGGDPTPTPPNQMKDWLAPGELKVWDTATGREVFEAKEPADSLGGVAFSPDGKRVAACGRGGLIKLWDAATGREDLSLRGHTGEATTLAFSPAGPRLVSGGADQAVRVWDIGMAPGPRVLEPNVGPLYDVAFSPHGRSLAAMGNSIKLWDPATGKDLLTIPRRGQQRLAFSPGGGRLATGNEVFDAATGRQLATFRQLPDRWGVAFSPRGQYVATTGFKVIYVWDAQTGEALFAGRGHARHVLSLAFSPDGTWLASGGDDNAVKLWDVARGKPVHTFVDSAYPVYALAFSPDGTRLAAATGSWRDAHAAGEVKVWDMVTRRELFTLRGHTEAVWGVAFSPDGKRLASCSGINVVLRGGAQPNQRRGEIKLWDAVSGQEVLTLRNAHRGRIFAVAFSPDGKRLASAGTDGVVKIWETTAKE